MQLATIPYSQHENELPQSGRQLIGYEEEDGIYLYQSFDAATAAYAVVRQKFGGRNYDFAETAWMTPSFLWMMDYSGWSSKPGKNRILAIQVNRKGFENILREGVYDKFQEDMYEEESAWRAAVQNSDVRIEWDNDYDVKGKKLDRETLQIGLKSSALVRFNRNLIRRIVDVTPFAEKQYAKLDEAPEEVLVVEEQLLELPGDIVERYSLNMAVES